MPLQSSSLTAGSGRSLALTASSPALAGPPCPGFRHSPGVSTRRRTRNTPTNSRQSRTNLRGSLLLRRIWRRVRDEAADDLMRRLTRLRLEVMPTDEESRLMAYRWQAIQTELRRLFDAKR